ncbi:MAG: tol-pal system protein YbgF, partial [Desulfonatronovibrionaceae bacterium]
ESGGESQTTQADLWAEVEGMKVQLATLTGRLDSLERDFNRTGEQAGASQEELDKLSRKTRELDRSMQMISSQLGVELSGEAPRAEAPSGEEDQKNQAEQEPEMDADAARILYQRALDSFYNRDYDKAQSLWKEFTDNFSEHPLAPNAYFWQGESFYQKGRYSEAVLVYQEVITNYPQSNKMAPSMLKQGMAFYHLDKADTGRIVLKELQEKFPDTVEARRAKSFMAAEE